MRKPELNIHSFLDYKTIEFEVIESSGEQFVTYFFPFDLTKAAFRDFLNTPHNEFDNMLEKLEFLASTPITSAVLVAHNPEVITKNGHALIPYTGKYPIILSNIQVMDFDEYIEKHNDAYTTFLFTAPDLYKYVKPGIKIRAIPQENYEPNTNLQNRTEIQSNTFSSLKEDLGK